MPSKKPKKMNIGQARKALRSEQRAGLPKLKQSRGLTQRNVRAKSGQFVTIQTDTKGTEFTVRLPTKRTSPTRKIEPLFVLDQQTGKKTTIQAPTLSRRKQKTGELEEFCKIVINKKTGKRKRICRTKDIPIKRKRRSKAIADNVAKIPVPKFARFNFL